MSGAVRACAACLGRSHLLALVAGHLDKVRAQIDELLTLADKELLEATAGNRREALRDSMRRFDPEQALARIERSGLEAICRCDASYPPQLAELEAPPAVLHVAGGLDTVVGVAAGEPVAIVGSRRASAYGLEVARSLGRALSVAGVPVISGMALGIDSAAHEGALAGTAPTLAVLPAGAERAYPASARSLHRRIVAQGAVLAELPPETRVRRWMFPARNRLIAALARMTVVVEAASGSGALLTASLAARLGRRVGAVPGHITSPQAAGCHALITGGARLVSGAEDILDAVYGAERAGVAIDCRPSLDSVHAALLEALALGEDAALAAARAGVSPQDGLAGLAWLELSGYVRRGAGGRYTVVA